MSDQPTTGLPRFPLPTETLVREGEDYPLLWLDGLLPLPKGSRIELGGPEVDLDSERFPTGHADAVVTGMTLSRTQYDSRFLVLEVELHEPGWRGLRGVALQGAAAEEAQAEEDVVEAAERITGTV